jgi:hypothetical protein
MLVFVAAATAGCGSGTHFANRPRPPAPVNMTVYVNDRRVSVSPSSVGAGPILFIITNQASNAESLAVSSSAGSTQPLADTGPISPQGTAQLSVNLKTPGKYTVAVAPSTGSTEAAAATPTGIQPALINVGSPRSNSNNQVAQP